MNEQERLKNELLEKLKTISNDEEFLLSVLNAARHMEDRKEIIRFIDKGNKTTYENIILLALTLYENREEKSI